MKFPTNASRQTTCPSCKKRAIGNDYPAGAPFERVSLTAGAMSCDRGTKNAISLGAFLMLGWSSPFNETGTTVEVANQPDPNHRAGNTLTLSFCSTKCLREFLNASVDKLEDRIDRAKKEQ